MVVYDELLVLQQYALLVVCMRGCVQVPVG